MSNPERRGNGDEMKFGLRFDEDEEEDEDDEWDEEDFDEEEED